jgi:hypothetical protein
MAIRSGLAAQIGFAEETTWSTAVTPSRFLEFAGETMKLTQKLNVAKGQRQNNLVERTDRWTLGTKDVNGVVNLEVQSKGYGMIFKHALGAVAITTPSGATNTRAQTFTLADNFGLGLTIQAGIPDTSGTVQAFNWAGGKIVDLELKNAVDGVLDAIVTFNAYDEVIGTPSLGTASYATSTQLLDWTGGTVNIASSPVGTVKDVTFKINRPMHLTREYIRTDRRHKEPIMNALVQITGTMTVEFENLTAYQRFVNGTLAQVDATWAAATAIEGSFYPSLQVLVNNCRFDGDTPAVASPDITMLTLPFVGLYDGTNGPISIVYQTSDTAI